jgi:hypothetical protein
MSAASLPSIGSSRNSISIERDDAVRLLTAVLASTLATTTQAQTVSCRGYPASVKSATKGRVEALRLIEREAADRLRGLDTRTFPFLAGRAREAADLIADGNALKEEEPLDHCREPIPQLRRICRDAALVLAAAMDEEEAGSAKRDARRAYAASISRCEALLGLSPLTTAWRVSE